MNWVSPELTATDKQIIFCLFTTEIFNTTKNRWQCCKLKSHQCLFRILITQFNHSDKLLSEMIFMPQFNNFNKYYYIQKEKTKVLLIKFGKKLQDFSGAYCQQIHGPWIMVVRAIFDDNNAKLLEILILSPRKSLFLFSEFIDGVMPH